MIWLVGCTETPDTGGDTGSPLPDPDATVLLSDANNYSYLGSLDAPSFDVRELSDITLGWAEMTEDLQCHTVDPVADIDNAILLVFPYLSEAEVEYGLANDTLLQSDLEVYLSQETGTATEVQLANMTFFGTDSEIETYFTASHGTWLVVLATGTEVAVGGRMLAFLHPTADGPDRADIAGGCDVLAMEADFHSLTPVSVPADGPWVVDWTNVTTDAHGNAFEPTRVDGVLLARFDESVEELEARFLDLELLAEETWTGTVTSGRSADLATLTGTTGTFPGFEAEGTYGMALTCSSCPNPAPLFLSFLEPG